MLPRMNRNPTLYGILSFVSFALNLLFHVIAYATNDWCHFTLHGRRVKLGLWLGCVYSDGIWECSDNIFRDALFRNGSDWHIGARVFMTCTLLVLFLMEFILIGYVCIQRCKPHRKQLVNAFMWMSFSVTLMTLLIIIIVGTETSYLEDGNVSVCYGLEILCFMLSIATAVLIYLDKRKQKADRTIATPKPNSVYSVRDDFETGSRAKLEFSFNMEGSSLNSRSTQDYRFDNAAFVKGSTRSLTSYRSDYTASTDLVSYFQEPIRRVSISSTESRV